MHVWIHTRQLLTTLTDWLVLDSDRGWLIVYDIKKKINTFHIFLWSDEAKSELASYYH